MTTFGTKLINIRFVIESNVSVAVKDKLGYLTFLWTRLACNKPIIFAI